VFDDYAMQRASLDLLSAWSAIEIALWDIVALGLTASASGRG
jgi:galactonate dehydratase